jgi:hypothetical protein
LANLSKLPAAAIDVLRQVLQGKDMVHTDELFEIVEDGSRAHGHVEAVLTAMRRLGFSALIHSRPSRQRDLVVAMVAARILNPQSKLATTRWWFSTTLPETLGLDQVDEDELYEAMDWLLEQQNNIEKNLASRHLEEGGLALYGLTSSYFEGVTCPLAERGHNRDGKKGKLQVNYGLLTNPQRIPVAVSVFKISHGGPPFLCSVAGPQPDLPSVPLPYVPEKHTHGEPQSLVRAFRFQVSRRLSPFCHVGNHGYVVRRCVGLNN